MATTYTKERKPGGTVLSALTWDEGTMSWDDATFTWDSLVSVGGLTAYTKETRPSVTSYQKETRP